MYYSFTVWELAQAGQSENKMDKGRAELKLQVYKNLMDGTHIDHQNRFSDIPTSLKYTHALMTWYGLDSQFQVFINHVFEGYYTAEQFKGSCCGLLSEIIADEILEYSHDEGFDDE